MPSTSYQAIQRYLIAQDKKLIPVIEAVAFPTAKRNRDIYLTLLQSIVSQQLSVKAASTIYARVLELFPQGYPDPKRLCRMPLSRLRTAGLSRQKSSYLKNIARFALQQDIAYASLARMRDEEIIAYLTEIKGVGQWTVEMLLMFAFNRPDVFSVNDVGIQNAMRRLYRIEHDGKLLRETLLNIAERWRPYRTIVCKYLWRWQASLPLQR